MDELMKLRQRIAELEAAASEHRYTMEALCRSEEKYRSIFNNTQDIYYEGSLDGIILEVSPSVEKILKYKREELLGRSVNALYFYPEERTIFLQVLQTTGKVTDYEITLKGGDGRAIICSINSMFTYDEKGTPKNIIGSIKDITIRKEAELALKESRNDLERLIGERTSELTMKNRQLIQEMTDRREAEEKVRAQEEKLRNIIEYSSNMFYAHDVNHVFTYVSPRSRDILDCEPEEALVRWTEFITDNPINKHGLELTQRAIDTGERQPPYELELLGKKGRKVQVEVHEAPVVKDGKTVAIVGAIRDITDRKHAEEALRLSEEKYRTILSSIEEGYYEIDLAGNLTFFNHSLVKMLGYGEEELMGMNNRRYTEKEVAKTVFRAYNEVYRTGVSSKQVDWELIRKDGSKINVETSVSLMRDVAGNPIGFRGILLDVTARKQAERALQESQQRLADIIEFLPDATLVIDIDGKVIAWNRAMEEMTGVKGQDIMGKGDYAYAIPFYGKRRPILIDLALKSDPNLEKQYASIQRHGYNVSGESLMLNMDGGKVFLWGTATPLRDPEGRIEGAIESIRDITDRKGLEEDIKNLSITDPLTGLYNRRGFMSFALQQIKISERTRRGMLLSYLDLDDLKAINDTLGHKQGDEALVEASQILKEVFRETDIIARMGGDEFAVISLEARMVSQTLITKRLEHCIDLHNAAGDKDYEISMSLGMVYFDPETPLSIDEWLSQADERMYGQKRLKKICHAS
ncbi:MAG: PAS domain S-box protein [Syntrophales bacterium]|nr:PAS domain S-box protein [Syntrophales bacterium]